MWGCTCVRTSLCRFSEICDYVLLLLECCWNYLLLIYDSMIHVYICVHYVFANHSYQTISVTHTSVNLTHWCAWWCKLEHRCFHVTSVGTLFTPSSIMLCGAVVTAGLAESNGSLLPGLWLSYLWVGSTFTTGGNMLHFGGCGTLSPRLPSPSQKNIPTTTSTTLA